MDIEKEREAKMENLKIRIGSKAESKEAQKLFFKLGYKWCISGKKIEHIELAHDGDYFYLVAWGTGIYANVIQLGFGNEDAREISLEGLRNLVAEKKKKKENELTLKQAKLAWANGEELQIDCGGGFYDLTGDYCLFAFDHPSNKFRLKPKTITLNGIEIPAIGTDYEQGEVIWILNSLEPKEYSPLLLDVSDELPTYWWSTEEEIKQVVAALRSAFFHA